MTERSAQEARRSGLLGLLNLSFALLLVCLGLVIYDSIEHLAARRHAVPAYFPPLIGGLFGLVGAVLLGIAIRRVASLVSDAEMGATIIRDAERCGWYRKQRHAFLNHIQVAYGLLALSKPGEAKEYLKRVVSTTGQFETDEICPSCPEIADMLRCKGSIAAERGMSLIITKWQACDRIHGSMLDLIGLLTDLIDGSIVELSKMRRTGTIAISSLSGAFSHTFVVEYESSAVAEHDATRLGQPLFDLGHDLPFDAVLAKWRSRGWLIATRTTPVSGKFIVEVPNRS